MGKQGVDPTLVLSNHHPHPTIVSQYGSHRNGVHAVRFRPLMKHLVSGGSDSAVYLWSLHCRPNLRHPVVRPYRFLGHHGPVYSVAVSPCDNLVASGSQDRSVRLWLPTVEGKSSVIKGHTGPVRTVNFSYDGQFLLSGSDDKTIKIWKVIKHRFVCALSGHMNWVRSAEFNADGRLILSGSDDKSVRLWDVEKRECVQQFTDVLGMVNSVRFHPDNCCVASGNSDHCIQMWDVRSKNLIQHYAANAGAVNSVCFHPSGNYLLSSCDDATLKIWDLREGQIVFTLQGHDGATHSAEFSTSGEYFASGSSDEHVLLWRTNIDLAGCQQERGLIGMEVVGHALCSACKCLCTSSPNEGGIHCPKRVNTPQSMESKETSSSCKLAVSPPPIKDAEMSVRCEAKLGHADQTTEEPSFRHTVRDLRLCLATHAAEPPSVVSACDKTSQSKRRHYPTTAKVHPSNPESWHTFYSTPGGAHEGESDGHQQELGSRSSGHVSDVELDVKRGSRRKPKLSIFDGASKRGCSAARVNRTPDSSAIDMESFGSTLEHICHQLSVLTRTVSLFEERLSHSEDKMMRLERRSQNVTPDEDSEDQCEIHG